MEYKYVKVLKKGEIVEVNGVPVRLLNDVEVGSNTDFEK